MSKTALITGATAGIGKALAALFAADGHDLVLVARGEERLKRVAEEFEARYKISARALPADLSEPDAPRRLFDTLAGDGVEIEYLVNNAGFGLGGRFADTDLSTELNMIQLNMMSLTAMTKLFMQPMIARGHGRIMNVASTAAFQPGPYMSVYCATKAYVLSLTEAISVELNGTGVTLTALCPGGTTTEFQARAKVEETKFVKTKMIPFMTAEAVAKPGYRAFMNGKTVVITGLVNRLTAFIVRFAPRKLTANVAGMILGE